MGKRSAASTEASSSSASKEKKSKSESKSFSLEPLTCEYSGINVTLVGAKKMKSIEKFEDAEFSSEILEYCKRFSTTTPIQAFSFPLIAKGKDLIGIAQTGSGKTAAFSLPVFDKLLKEKSEDKKIKFIVLCPTRELCLQTFSVFQDICKFTRQSACCIYGGVSKDDQRRELKKKPLAIVATPGRLNDFLDSNEIDISSVSFAVLDEADRMLDLGFEPEVRKILGHIESKKRQTLMFSATWPTHVQRLAGEFLREPISLTIGSKELTANSQISQTVHVLDDPYQKNDQLRNLMAKNANKAIKIIVFVLYKVEATKVELFLKGLHYNVVSIHGDKNQHARTEAFETFKNGKCNVLVATDVAARGLDIPNVELVINYTFPLTIEDYIHRIGRTGRAKKTGISITFFTNHDKAHSGELVNVLKKSNQNVPEALLKFGTTIKKKEHKEYGAFYKEIDPNVKGKRKTFDD
jgi:ATP-dependent RNA helicase DBP3